MTTADLPSITRSFLAQLGAAIEALVDQRIQAATELAYQALHEYVLAPMVELTQGELLRHAEYAYDGRHGVMVGVL